MFANMYACVPHTVGSPGTGVADSCELPRGSWGLNTGPLEGHQCSQLLIYQSSPQKTSFNDLTNTYDLNMFLV